jgi:uncharacterized protein YecT (DUF1311 family)
MRFPTRLPCIFALLWFSLSGYAQTKPETEITQDEIKQVINGNPDYSDCENVDELHIDHLEYFDFTGDGQKEAVVVASTCMTGTAGPDVHAVYARDANGKVVEHSLDRIDPVTGTNSQKLPVFGNPNYGIAVENGQLVARWMDSSDRERPLIIWYKWDGKEFVSDHMKVDGPFKTSYDCAKATKEMDRAICYSPKIASLDLQLAKVYRAALQEGSDREAVRQQQIHWLAMREKQCTIYKWWVDCLSDLYTKRIADLQHKPGAQAAQ